MGRREEETVNLYHHLTPPMVSCSLPRPLKLCRPLHHSVHFLLSLLPRYCPFLVPNVSLPQPARAFPHKPYTAHLGVGFTVGLPVLLT